MTGDAARLAAEILSEDDGRGSGFLIADGLVLTALHVLLGGSPPETVPAEVRARVRFEGDLIDARDRMPSSWNRAEIARRLRESPIPWHGAKLVWPKAGAQSASYDIALLALDEPRATRLTPISPIRAYAHAAAKRKIGCRGEGYPEFKVETIDGESIWQLESLSGELLPVERRLDHAIRISVRGSDTPDDLDGWQGMSGGAIWIDGESRVELVGVAHARSEGLKQNNEVLCWPLSTIPADDPDFWALSGIAPPPVRTTAAPATAKPLAAQLGDNFFRFDRSRATGYFREWLRGDAPGRPPRFNRPGPPTRPGLVLLKSHRFDEPMLCAKRFAEMLAQEAYPRRADAYREPIQTSCGVADDPAEIRLDALFREWAASYAPPLTELRPDFHAVLLAGLAARDRPRVVVIEHDDRSFGEECAGVIDRVIDLLAAWQPGAEDETCPPVVLLSVVTGTKGGPHEAGYEPLDRFPGKEESLDSHIAALVERTPRSADGLPLVEWCRKVPDLGRPAAMPRDIGTWLDDIARRDSIALPSGLQIGIERELGRRDEFPVRFAKYAVEDAMARQEV